MLTQLTNNKKVQRKELLAKRRALTLIQKNEYSAVITKDIELSDDKKKEIRVEAEKEAKHSDEPLEKIIERKENEVKDEIRAVAKDIVHYKDVMTKLSALGIPDRYLSR